MDEATRQTIKAFGYSDAEISVLEELDGQPLHQEQDGLIAQTTENGTDADAAEPTGQLAERPDGPILLSDLWRYYKPDGGHGAFTMAERKE